MDKPSEKHLLWQPGPVKRFAVIAFQANGDDETLDLLFSMDTFEQAKVAAEAYAADVALVTIVDLDTGESTALGW
jgi:hypothetical protein